MVAAQINERWGAEAVKEYDPRENCFTLPTWNRKGYRVKKGEKALHSVTWIPLTKKDEKGDAQEIGRKPRNVNLFFIRQVEKVDGPLAVCGSVIAEAFGMGSLPNVQVIEEQRAPGVVALTFGFERDI